jgi:transcriptional regulator with XRE-family HTH domain
MVTEHDKQLGKRIQALRQKTDLRQEDLAEKVQLSTKYIQFIETGHRVPSLKTLYKISNVLKVKVSELFPF